MKQCDWCLWLGENRIFNIRQLREHFDTALLTGYLIGGVLERWLSDAKETEILARVRKIDFHGDIGEQLEFLFGVNPEKKTRLSPEEQKRLQNKAKKTPPFFAGGSFRAGSFRKGSFRTGSFRTGSFHTSSFRTGSFHTGSFRTGSFHAGSFRTGSFRKKFGSGKGSGGSSFRLLSHSSGGSFRFYAGNTEITEGEYRRTMINLSSCPLNEYGYGIHLI